VRHKGGRPVRGIGVNQELAKDRQTNPTITLGEKEFCLKLIVDQIEGRRGGGDPSKAVRRKDNKGKGPPPVARSTTKLGGIGNGKRSANQFWEGRGANPPSWET